MLLWGKHSVDKVWKSTLPYDPLPSVAQSKNDSALRGDCVAVPSLILLIHANKAIVGPSQGSISLGGELCSSPWAHPLQEGSASGQVLSVSY